MLAPWKKSYDKLSILKSRDITLPTKVCLVKAMVFPVVMCGCESWTIKKTEHQRIDAFFFFMQVFPSIQTFFSIFIYLFILFVVNFVIHWNETAMGLHVLVLEKALESRLDFKEIHPVNPKGNQS